MSGKGYLNNIQLQRAWGDGLRAAQTGQLISTNPHLAGTPAKAAWDDGFNGTFSTG